MGEMPRKITRPRPKDRGWLYRLMTGLVERTTEAPAPRWPMIVPGHVDLSLADYSTSQSVKSDVNVGI